MFFTADDGTRGTELWATDGTPAGTRLVEDIQPGDASSAPEGLAAVGDTLYFSADDGTHGRELWRSDGTAAGTEMLVDLRSGGPDADGSAARWPSRRSEAGSSSPPAATGPRIASSGGATARPPAPCW